MFGADYHLPGMLTGRAKRSPHAHAKIVLDRHPKAAEALPGVKAVVTVPRRFTQSPSGGGEIEGATCSATAVRDVAGPTAWRRARRSMLGTRWPRWRRPARRSPGRGAGPDRGHLRSAAACNRCRCGDGAQRAGASRRPLHGRASSRSPTSPRTWPSAWRSPRATSRPGSQKADVIVEREFRTAPVHQGYIEPHAALASVSEDGSTEVWCSTQGHFIVRAHCARLLGMDIGQDPRHRLRDRRRLRGQDGGLSRAARASRCRARPSGP